MCNSEWHPSQENTNDEKNSVMTKERFGAFLWIDGTQPAVFVSLVEAEISYSEFTHTSTLFVNPIDPTIKHNQHHFILYCITSKVAARGPTTP